MGLPPDSLILDPYMGVGSTIVAALDEGRRAIGIEIARGYCEVARRRIDARPRPPLGAVATGDRFSRPITSTRGRGGIVPPGR
jgi:hypothetical protein